MAEIEKNLQNPSSQPTPQPSVPPPPTVQESNPIIPQVSPQKVSTVNSAYVAGAKAANVVFVDKSSEKNAPNIKKGEITIQLNNKKERTVSKMMPINAIKKNLKK